MDTDTFQVCAEVAELLAPADLDTLRRSAATGYRCVSCDEPGQLGAEPAAVVVRLTAAPGTGPGGRGLRHYNVSISTSEQMIANKFRGRLDHEAIIGEMTAAVMAARAGGAETILSLKRWRFRRPSGNP